ncbi:MAG TPA: SRPBCC family protein [Bryobacteraceae bacterium]|jgi:uncharacterized membrane protein|nr:SRPBCC family protein [Bryobacteraceae bacterium]
MSGHERTFTVKAPPEEVWRYLSSVSNLPDFVPYLESMREDEPGHVFGICNYGEGRRTEVSGFFRTDEMNRRLDWESDGTPQYSGWLEIRPEGREQSSITVHIEMPSAASEVPPPEAGLAGDRLERAFDSVVHTIQEKLERVVVPSRSAV